MEENFNSKFNETLNEFELKIKNSFSSIRKDISEVYKKVDLFRDYLNSWDDKVKSAWEKEEGIRNTLTKDVNEFGKKLSQLKLALSSIRSIKSELVVVRDLAKIEQRVRDSFKEHIKSHREEIIRLNDKVLNLNERLKELENSIFKKNKRKNSKSWSFGSNFSLI